jgi:hypothetical protein
MEYGLVKGKFGYFVRSGQASTNQLGATNNDSTDAKLTQVK